MKSATLFTQISTAIYIVASGKPFLAQRSVKQGDAVFIACEGREKWLPSSTIMQLFFCKLILGSLI
jgi:hypothetical protein